MIVSGRMVNDVNKASVKIKATISETKVKTKFAPMLLSWLSFSYKLVKCPLYVFLSVWMRIWMLTRV